VLYHDVPCRFCYKSACPQGHHDCLNKVEPAQVIDAVQSLLQAASSDGSEAEKPLPFRAPRGISIDSLAEGGRDSSLCSD
jgi:hypothetical protein